MAPGRGIAEVDHQRERPGGGVAGELRHRCRRGHRHVVAARLGVAAARTGDRQFHRVDSGGRIAVARCGDGAGAAIAEGPGVAGDGAARRVAEVHRQRERPGDGIAGELRHRYAIRHCRAYVIGKSALRVRNVIGGRSKVVGRSFHQTGNRVGRGVADVDFGGVVAGSRSVVDLVPRHWRTGPRIPRQSDAAREGARCHDKQQQKKSA